jgi:hypothetical protein
MYFTSTKGNTTTLSVSRLNGEVRTDILTTSSNVPLLDPVQLLLDPENGSVAFLNLELSVVICGPQSDVLDQC